jgi:hypothetical protein
LTCRESEAAQIIQFGAGGSTARRECGLDVGALVGFGAEQF